jgi:hypothetical protein
MPPVEIALACPGCGAAARVVVVEGREDERPVVWTDGYQEIGGRPLDQLIARCSGCRRLYWLEAAQPVDRSSSQPLVEPVDENSYYEALDAGLAVGVEQELALRVLAWWRSNDRFRKGTQLPRHPTEPRVIDNLERLIVLCAEGDHEIRLTRVEALRQLARFDEASETLAGLCSDYDAAGRKLAALIAARSRSLEILFD